MKIRFKTIFLTASMLLTGACTGAPAPVNTTKNEVTTTVAAPEPEPVFRTATEIAADMGLGWNLGNTMEAYEATGCEKITFEWIPVKLLLEELYYLLPPNLALSSSKRLFISSLNFCIFALISSDFS